MAKPQAINLEDGTLIPILYEDRSVLAIDKPPGWLLAPDYWDKTGRNLQLALQSSIKAGDFWARSRGLKFLRFIHRLDEETSGVLLLVKSAGAVAAYSELFESRSVEKTYLAVVRGIPPKPDWTCDRPIGPVPEAPCRMKVDAKDGKSAETCFRILKSGRDTTLIEARPLTGRTHQIRVHLQASGQPVMGDPLYGGNLRPSKIPAPLALRAIVLGYRDPFTKRAALIKAPFEEFVRAYGFATDSQEFKAFTN